MCVYVCLFVCFFVFVCISLFLCEKLIIFLSAKMHRVCVCCGRTFQLDIISFTHGVVTAHVHITCSWNILLTCKGHTCWYAPGLIEGPSFVSNVFVLLLKKTIFVAIVFVCLSAQLLFFFVFFVVVFVVVFFESVVSLLLCGHSEALSDLPLLGTMDLSHSVITICCLFVYVSFFHPFHPV